MMIIVILILLLPWNQATVIRWQPRFGQIFEAWKQRRPRVSPTLKLPCFGVSPLWSFLSGAQDKEKGTPWCEKSALRFLEVYSLVPQPVWLEQDELPMENVEFQANRLCQTRRFNQWNKIIWLSFRAKQKVMHGPQVTWRPAVCPEIGWYLDIRRDGMKCVSNTRPAAVAICGCSRMFKEFRDMKRWVDVTKEFLRCSNCLTLAPHDGQTFYDQHLLVQKGTPKKILPGQATWLYLATASSVVIEFRSATWLRCCMLVGHIFARTKLQGPWNLWTLNPSFPYNDHT